jgi:hypothetical protein
MNDWLARMQAADEALKAALDERDAYVAALCAGNHS